MNEDAVWNELKDDWTGRVYRSIPDGNLAVVVVKKDLNSKISYTLESSSGEYTKVYTIGKSVIESDIAHGLLIRVK